MHRETYQHWGLVWIGLIGGCLLTWWLVIYGVWCFMTM